MSLLRVSVFRWEGVSLNWDGTDRIGEELEASKVISDFFSCKTVSLIVCIGHKDLFSSLIFSSVHNLLTVFFSMLLLCHYDIFAI